MWKIKYSIMKEKKEKVDWRKEYMLDCIFNNTMLFITFMLLSIYKAHYIYFIPVIIQILVNSSSAKFFSDKYE